MPVASVLLALAGPQMGGERRAARVAGQVREDVGPCGGRWDGSGVDGALRAVEGRPAVSGA
ncbi:hypothetical protein ACFT9I_01660 [Streptomyces sp. NPDC057137]|uniref:hypothetical protein n=1 Tax=Streptomyces sp. NPDC057137 TaxID=3346030 RepID=UPI003642EA1E